MDNRLGKKHISEKKKVAIEKLQGHYCFACGTANPIGLNLQFYRLGDAICSDLTLMKYHEGWENIAHGGIISTLLDEIMSWAIIYFKRAFVVTRKMEVKYVRHILIGTPLIVKGMLIEDPKYKGAKAKAEIRDDKGHLLVTGNGEFALLS
ncbi:MAG: PaaI family thioesterase, partial [ANME-2 cluster archaeon]